MNGETTLLHRPRKLHQADDCSQFSSGAAELDYWLKEFAFENQQAHNAVTYVTTVDQQVVGYYALAAGAIQADQASTSFAQRRPDPIPCVLLARLAVDQSVQGQGIGYSLFRDALIRVLTSSNQLGVAALLIQCRDAKAKSFYLAQADLLESPADPMTLLLPIKTLQKLFR